MTNGDRRVVLVTEDFYPNEAGTPFLLTQLAQSWSRSGEDVVVITCAEGGSLGGVSVRRVGASAGRGYTMSRVVRMIRNTVRLLAEARRVVTKSDCLVAVVGPSLVPSALALFAARRARRFVLIVHDVYPEAALAAGVIRRGSIAARVWQWSFEAAMSRSDSIIAIGHDMQRLLKRLHPGSSSRVQVIHHWSDPASIRPIEREMSSAFQALRSTPAVVLQYAGNLGLTHGVQDVLDAAGKLRSSFSASDVCVQFIGDGALRNSVEAEAGRNELVRYLGVRKRDEQSDFLGSADISVVAYRAGMVGTSVPSRLPGILCSGRAVLAIAEPGSDISDVVTQHELGWVVPPGDVDGIVRCVAEAVADPDLLKRMGTRSRAVALTLPSLDQAAGNYLSAFFSDCDQNLQQPAK